MTSRIEYSTQTPKKSTLFSTQYLRNHWTLDISVLGYIGIVWPKKHSPEVRSFPPGTPCINCRVIKNTLKYKSCSNMFRFTQESSSGSQSQCLAKITGMVPLCLSIWMLSVWWGWLLRSGLILYLFCRCPNRQIKRPKILAISHLHTAGRASDFSRLLCLWERERRTYGE